MAQITIKGARIAGVCTCVPSKRFDNLQDTAEVSPRARLVGLGFEHIGFLPSPLPVRKQYLRGLYSAYHTWSVLFRALTFGLLTLTPSFITIPRKR